MTIQLSNQAIFAATSGGTPPNAHYSLGSDGNVYKAINNAPAVDIGDWITPKSGMSGYEAKAVLISGPAPNLGTLDTWLNLGTGSAVWTQTDGSKGGAGITTVIDVAIQPVGGGSSVTARITLLATWN